MKTYYPKRKFLPCTIHNCPELIPRDPWVAGDRLCDRHKEVVMRAGVFQNVAYVGESRGGK